MTAECVQAFGVQFGICSQASGKSQFCKDVPLVYNDQYEDEKLLSVHVLIGALFHPLLCDGSLEISSETCS